MTGISLADKHQFSRQGKITEDFFDIRFFDVIDEIDPQRRSAKAPCRNRPRFLQPLLEGGLIGM